MNIYNVSMTAILLVLAMGFGTVFAWTRSLIPAIVAHAIIDVPTTPPWQGLLLVALVIGGVVTWKHGVAVVRHVFSRASTAACVALGVVGTSWAIAAQRIDALAFVAVAMVILAVGLEAMDRRRIWAAEPTPKLS